MLELLFSLLLQLSLLQGTVNKPVDMNNAASGKKETTITINKAPAPSPTGIGSGGWDDKN